ncbi:MAG: hypothetical protein A3J66_02150 [Candidatus Magasanikbacteria bacterium RIFCSPHIGHO2_02_FULL_47_14]|uniref:CYTH domain-containing protein n=1 Tax=Candidatus Magasanikbacteria bacterium RIFCSPHIGHO2_02_FULL_47_14 TaxID=1798680 RepID=A0A1F6MB74_9BACT|nr:MAG: hypothetical protein A3J66_02150 [Candidatus Magasanikbacteria bacterium RIFCSPHIGHO2_02_FULL_47_14]
MKETELKILDINPDTFVARLEALGAKKIATRKIIDKQFDTPAGDINKKKELLRLRKDDEQGFLAFKTNRVKTEHIQSCDEFEVAVSDIETAEKIIIGLGFIQTRYREKIRTSYLLDDVRVEIEKYPTIPYYIELEGDEPAITALVEKLGYTMDSTTSWTATKVLKHYGEDPSLQVFEP